MKKLGLLLCGLFILPFGVFAASNPKVTEINSKVEGNIISYTGTTETGSHAVMCKLYNSKDEEIDLLSTAVDNTKFEGEFIVSEIGTYTLECANYEGGELKKVDVVVEKITDEKNNAENNPKTGDNYVSLIIILGVSVIGLALCAIYFKSKQVKKINK